MNDFSRTTRCPECGSAELLRVDLTVEAVPMAFTSCPQCEARWWERDGSALPLTAVLAAVGRR
jgi:uncharacterized protein with PIN domain